MTTLILNHEQVERLLPMPACVDLMADTLADLARGAFHLPLRMVNFPPGAPGGIGLMPAYRYAPASKVGFGLKAVVVYPKNPERGKDAHQGSVMLFDPETGELRALMNASAITAIRTAAVSGVATRLLANPDAGDLALVGAGTQARYHLEAMACVRPIRRARVVARHPERARRFAEELGPRFSFPIEPVETVEAAVRGADLIVTATNSREPIVGRDWVAPGAHLNVVGSSVKTDREVDTALMAASRLYVDRRESTLNEGVEYLFAAADGAIGPDPILAELGELLTGTRSGRSTPAEITLFKSLGLAVEDLASAQYLYDAAKEANAGTWVDY